MDNLIYVFDNWFVDSRRVYYCYFDTIPNVYDILQIKGEEAYKKLRETYASQIRYDFNYGYFDHQGKKTAFKKALLLLDNRCVLTFLGHYCEILHDGTQPEFVSEVIKVCRSLKGRAPRKPFEIHIISRSDDGFELKGMEIKRTRLDIDLFYEDDFKPVDEVIRKRLSQKKTSSSTTPIR